MTVHCGPSNKKYLLGFKLPNTIKIFFTWSKLVSKHNVNYWIIKRDCSPIWFHVQVIYDTIFVVVKARDRVIFTFIDEWHM